MPEDFTSKFGLDPGSGQPKPIKNTGHIGLAGVDATGTPHCTFGPMRWHGHTRSYLRYVAPRRRTTCSALMQPPAPSGPSTLKPEMSPRYICEIPRASEAWDKEYDRRTTVERSHDRKKNDFDLEARYNRARHVVFALYVLAGYLQHVIAWAKRVDGRALLAAWLPQAA